MLNAQKRRLVWNCRRGMLELDMLLNSFLDKHLHTLSEDEIRAFESLLLHNDPQLYAWLMGFDDPPVNELNEIVCLIRNHH